jgi:hypothetical protein
MVPRRGKLFVNTMEKNLNLIFGLIILLSGIVLADSTATGRITLSAVPDSSEFFINGLARIPDDQNGFSVEPGPVLFEIKRVRVVVLSTFFLLNSTEEQRITLDCIDNCALLHVITDPPGATLSVNGTTVGTTPYMDRFRKPGSLSIMITQPGHIPVIRKLELSNDSSEVFSFQLEYTQAVKDSLAAAKRALRKRRQTIQGTVFGGLGVAALLAGGYYDLKAYHHLEKAQKASEAYDAAKSRGDCQAEKKRYLNERQLAERPITYRNALYGAVGACLAGFYFSFIF